MAEALDRAAYTRQIDLLCAPQTTCFVNFFTNPGNLPLTMPLPDAIAGGSTALFRRSTKQGAEMFRRSCRMAVGETGCF